MAVSIKRLGPGDEKFLEVLARDNSDFDLNGRGIRQYLASRDGELDAGEGHRRGLGVGRERGCRRVLSRTRFHGGAAAAGIHGA